MSADAELRAFANDLGKIAVDAVPEANKILEKGALNIKNGLVENLRASSSFKGMAGSISYDPKFSGLTSLGYVIGPDKARRGGALGNIAFFGTSRGGGTVDLEGPLREEAPVIEGLLEDLVGEWADSV